MKETVLKYLLAAQEDNLERAELAFSGLSEAEMNQPHGQSLMTRLELLNSYRSERQRWQAAVDWVKSR